MPWQEDASQKVGNSNPSWQKIISLEISVYVSLHDHLVMEFVHKSELYQVLIVSCVFVADVPQIRLKAFKNDGHKYSTLF